MFRTTYRILVISLETVPNAKDIDIILPIVLANWHAGTTPEAFFVTRLESPQFFYLVPKIFSGPD